ncbi:Hsp20/alpha crystallin family protein [Niveibacterium sp. SC-1]|uniref:Hsp20/alpha crystallin family protein n=1 Tax=Niveibacterium sp. SC-1 TaxID=3135646 RepID=UPI00311FF7F1
MAYTQTNRSVETAALVPYVDVHEDATSITLFADLPGVSKEQLSVQVDADVLTIEGAVSLAAPEGLGSLHTELRVPRYRRAFTLSRELDAEQVSAELQNGVLKLRIPKKAHAQPRKIAVTLN